MLTVIIAIIGLTALFLLAVVMAYRFFQNKKKTKRNGFLKAVRTDGREEIILGRLENTDYNIRDVKDYLKLTNSFCDTDGNENGRNAS